MTSDTDEKKIALMDQIVPLFPRDRSTEEQRKLDVLIECYRKAPGHGTCARCSGTLEERPAISRRGLGEICSLCGWMEAFGG